LVAKSIRLGFLTHLEGSGDPRRIYQDSLELFVAADQLGFDVGWIAQHHLQDFFGRLPSPFPFLAAAAERTRRIRLGTAVVILPLESPLRTAEDAAVVDTLSGGRLEFGVGSGFSPPAFVAFGIDQEKRRELTSDNLAIVKRALQGEPLTADGVRLQPPAPGLADRLWQAVFSGPGGAYVARNGNGLLINRAAYGFTEQTDTVQTPWAQAYLDAWSDSIRSPRIGVSRTVYPAADSRTAKSHLVEGVLHFAKVLIEQNKLPSGLSSEEYFDRLHVIHGHPDEVVAGLLADSTFGLATDLLCQFNPGGPSLDQSIRALELIATKVAPQLGWRPQPSGAESLALTGSGAHA
jgi:alkanesulfonate monooxygenase SsuD/methylene tetrahydromethanopterin reductase-like flavin-dependent oxidoreductase (luciferase family)